MSTLAKRSIVLSVACSLIASGCATPQQLRERYTSFDQCFRETKNSNMVVGAVGGALAGALAAAITADKSKPNQKQRTVGGMAVGAAAGAAIGYSASWRTCLVAFPVKSETTTLAARDQVVSASGPTPQFGLQVEGIEAADLSFGQPISIRASFRYTHPDPSKRDIRAKYIRVLSFKSPSGELSEIQTEEDVVIQQGRSRSNFEIPTPSLAEAPDLASVTDWQFRFIVEVDGTRLEQKIDLGYPGKPSANIATATSSPNEGQSSSAGSKEAPVPATEKPIGKFRVVANTPIYDSPKATPKTVHRLKSNQEVTVFERQKIGALLWMRIETPDGIKGWIRQAVKP